MDKAEVEYHNKMRFTFAGWTVDVHPGSAVTLNFG